MPTAVIDNSKSVVKFQSTRDVFPPQGSHETAFQALPITTAWRIVEKIGKRLPSLLQ